MLEADYQATINATRQTVATPVAGEGERRSTQDSVTTPIAAETTTTSNPRAVTSNTSSTSTSSTSPSLNGSAANHLPSGPQHGGGVYFEVDWNEQPTNSTSSSSGSSAPTATVTDASRQRPPPLPAERVQRIKEIMRDVRIRPPAWARSIPDSVLTSQILSISGVSANDNSASSSSPQFSSAGSSSTDSASKTDGR